MLVEGWVSQASARQRRGRAGRVRPGHCFRLFTRFMHDRRFHPFQLPEIKRVPLEGLCLQVRARGDAGRTSPGPTAPRLPPRDAEYSREYSRRLGVQAARLAGVCSCDTGDAREGCVCADREARSDALFPI